MASFASPNWITGLTVACTTQSTFLMDKIIKITLPKSSCKQIDTTTFADTTGKSIGGKIRDNGMLKLTIQHDIDLDIGSFTNVSDTFTITFPKSPSTASTAATWAFTGYLADFTPQGLGVDDLATADVEIKVNGAITFVAQT